ncbi:hypothetical protein EDD15DRAFT_2257372 [Pisolithus albus]|nr:hypothetical protein EDD15DRAFT_2257372 [Pisolithus albus]
MGTPTNQILIIITSTTSATLACSVRRYDIREIGTAMPVERYERKPHGNRPSHLHISKVFVSREQLTIMFELELLPRSLHFSLLYCAQMMETSGLEVR